MNQDRLVISNELWEKIAPLLPGKAGDPGATAVIAPKANRKGQRDYDIHMYKWRRSIENYFARIKEFRGIETRYDKTDTSYAANCRLCARLVAQRSLPTNPSRLLKNFWHLDSSINLSF